MVFTMIFTTVYVVNCGNGLICWNISAGKYEKKITNSIARAKQRKTKNDTKDELTTVKRKKN